MANSPSSVLAVALRFAPLRDLHGTPRDSVEKRGAQFNALDPLVQRWLPRLLEGHPHPIIAGLTVYDAVYPAIPNVGGHWTVASCRMDTFSHTIWSYAVLLVFDADDHTSHFVIAGATELSTTGTSEAELAEGIVRARMEGPLETTAPHVLTDLAF